MLLQLYKASSSHKASALLRSPSIWSSSVGEAGIVALYGSRYLGNTKYVQGRPNRGTMYPLLLAVSVEDAAPL